MKSGDILAEIETDKATMEFEAVDEGTIAKILVPEGTDGVKVGAPIAIMAGEGEDARALRRRRPIRPAAEAPKAAPPRPRPRDSNSARRRKLRSKRPPAPPQPAAAPRAEGDRMKASPLARRLAQAQGIDLAALQGSGPGGRIVRADIDAAAAGAGRAPAAARPLRRAVATTPCCRGRSSRRSRTRRSSFRTCARRSRAA